MTWTHFPWKFFLNGHGNNVSVPSSNAWHKAEVSTVVLSPQGQSTWKLWSFGLCSEKITYWQWHCVPVDTQKGQLLTPLSPSLVPPRKVVEWVPLSNESESNSSCYTTSFECNWTSGTLPVRNFTELWQSDLFYHLEQQIAPMDR